jgi:hypothetical protein
VTNSGGAVAEEEDRVGDKPVLDHVVAAGDMVEARGRVAFGCREHHRHAWIRVPEPAREPLPAPRAAEVEPVQVGYLAVGRIGDHGGRKEALRR